MSFAIDRHLFYIANEIILFSFAFYQIENPTLNYTEVVFEAAEPSTETQIRAFVHGDENGTLYSEIDLLHRASESDDDDFMYVDGIEQFTLKDNKHAT